MYSGCVGDPPNREERERSPVARKCGKEILRVATAQRRVIALARCASPSHKRTHSLSHHPSRETTPVFRPQVEKFISTQVEEKILTAVAEGVYSFAAGAVQCLDDTKVGLPFASSAPCVRRVRR